MQESPQAEAVMTRYRDAYLVARAINGIGSLIKTVAIVAGAIVFIVGLVMATESPALGLAGILLGVGLGAILYLLGLLLGAQGQILKATLDNAVHSSPFLSNEQRVHIMALKAVDESATDSYECAECGADVNEFDTKCHSCASDLTETVSE